MSQSIDYTRFSRGDGCTEEGCKAKKYYIEDGKMICQRGHEQTGFTQSQRDDDNWNDTGRVSRKAKDKTLGEERIFRGSKALELYLSCYQLILWKQCHWLVTVKEFPPELEVIVKDLWELRIGVMKSGAEQSIYTSASASASVYSSAGEGDNTDTDGSGGRSVSSRRSKSIFDEDATPKLIETLGLCYLGMLLMKLPVSLGDIYKWATRDEIIYTRAIKEVPREMRFHLPSHFHSALEIRAPLKGMNLHGVVLDLVKFYNLQFDMEFPPLNSPPLIFKHVRDLGLPIEIYAATHRMAALLEFDFSYQIPLKRTFTALLYPEVKIISMIVVATKLCYPFDKIKRSPQSDSDPTTSNIDWAEWFHTMAKKPIKGLRRGEEMDVTDADVLTMSEKQIDDYMDWYQRTWIDDRQPKLSEEILKHFPLKELPPRPEDEPQDNNIADKVKMVQNSLVVQKPTTIQQDEMENIILPGGYYSRYGSAEDLPRNAKPLFDLAAKNTGIDLETLIRGVLQVERQWEKWAMAEKKRNKAAEEQEMSYSEEEEISHSEEDELLD